MRFCCLLGWIIVLLMGCQAKQDPLADPEQETSMLAIDQATVVTLREGTDLHIEGLNLGVLQILYAADQPQQSIGVRIRFLTKPAIFNYHTQLMLDQTITVANYQVQLLSIEQSSIQVAIRLTAEQAPILPIEALGQEQLLIAPANSSVGDGYLTITIGDYDPANGQVELSFWVSSSVPELKQTATLGQVIEYQGYRVRVLWLPNAAYPMVALGLQAE
ncbi:MAG TPA: hypothetical protein DEF47_14245 [Herpetosiphon sp.]|uniref:Lipoprotein n=1 Tax=Herpetosiphon aurantiacus (strain ATCC 23779 / DSM 785 / 114-95) TaxID=316274 RepID=A9B2A4_HERA2|nr:hypothetical protein [Herpetosiphon sp.]ABX03949.1 hypothetical protein Haur_1301 [Herpetosiphon aurantiacus DSM 785]HBW51051.1 hypothetical protein [Herpetosiphon sp.]